MLLDDKTIMVAQVSLGSDGFSSQRPRKLFSVERPIHSFDVTQDGERILVTLRQPPPSPQPVHIVVNWDLELTPAAE